MVILKLNREALNRAEQVLNAGGVVVFPTDTVYGFLADAHNKKAVENIFKIKNRPKTKPLAVFVKDVKMAKELADISNGQEKILKKKWPGKFTFVLKSKIKSKLITKDGTIALRMPKYNFLNQLLKKINKPLAQTSANISGEEVIGRVSDMAEKFSKEKILIIDGGNLKNKKASAVINLINNEAVRIR